MREVFCPLVLNRLIFQYIQHKIIFIDSKYVILIISLLKALKLCQSCLLQLQISYFYEREHFHYSLEKFLFYFHLIFCVFTENFYMQKNHFVLGSISEHYGCFFVCRNCVFKHTNTVVVHKQISFEL